MSLLAFELILRFLWGSLLVLAFVSRVETSERFPRLAAMIAAGTAVSAVALVMANSTHTNNMLFAAGSLVLGAFLYAYGQARMLRVLGFLLHVLLCPVLFLWGKGFFDVLNFVISGFVFGSIFSGQFLGHWFLTVPGMHIRELAKVSNFIILSLVLKTAEILMTIFLVLNPSDVAPPVDVMGVPLGANLNDPGSLVYLGADHSLLGLRGDGWLGLGLFGLIVFVMRILWGIVAPLIFAFMVKKTVSLRSTQSATGILYAMCVMVIIGEGAALYLKSKLGWNL